MGEKIKILGKSVIKNQKIEVELNKPLSKGKDYQIHIQSETNRIEFNKKDFIQYAFSILTAAKHLKKIKNIND